VTSGDTVSIISDEGMRGITDTIKSAQLCLMGIEDNVVNTEQIYESFRPNMKDDKGDFDEAVEWFNKTLMEIGDDRERIRNATYDEGVVFGFRYIYATFESRDENPLFMFDSLTELLQLLHDDLIDQREKESEEVI